MKNRNEKGTVIWEVECLKNKNRSFKVVSKVQDMKEENYLKMQLNI